MTRKEAYRRLRRTSTPEKVVRYRKHDRERCLAVDDEMTGIPPATCSCTGKPRYGYGVVLDLSRN